MIRLEINISDDTEAALRKLVAREGVSYTEAVRRLVGYGTHIDATYTAGGEVFLRYAGGDMRRLVNLA